MAETWSLLKFDYDGRKRFEGEQHLASKTNSIQSVIHFQVKESNRD